MAAINGTTGLVTSWAGTANTALISTGSAPSEFSWTLHAPEVDTTPFVSAGATVMRFIPNIYDGTVSIKTRINPASIGNKGNVTFSGGYATNIKEWSVTLATDPQESTAFSGSTVLARTYIPSLLNWSGSYTGYVDGTTPLEPVGEVAAALVLKAIEDGATDVQLSGNAFSTQLASTVRVGQIAEASYSFRGDGDITSAVGAGSFTAWFFAAGVVAPPVVGSLVLQAATGRTYTMDAFWESVTVACAVDGLVTADITARISGVVSIA